MIDFRQAYAKWLEEHEKRRMGERRGRLVRGHGHAEQLFLQQVWWPAVGSLDHLHPEYEVLDWNRKSQFLDFAYTPPFGKFGLECDGFQSHVRDMDREKFSYALNRDTFLTSAGWTMLHFSYDDVSQRPELARSLLQMVLAPYRVRQDHPVWLTADDKEILRLVWSLGRAARTHEVAAHLRCGFRTARKRLQTLAAKGLLTPILKNAYITGYEAKELVGRKLF